MQDRIVYLNGEWTPLVDAKISVLDRGFIYGDGVYEVIPVFNRVPFLVNEHLNRLQQSIDASRMAMPFTREVWLNLIQQSIDRHDGQHQYIYLQVTRGVAKRDPAFPKNVEQTVFLMNQPLVRPSHDQRMLGVSVMSAVDVRWYMCHIKSTSLIANVLMRQHAADHDCVETILFRDGFLSEASSSNVLIVKDGTLFSPPQNNQILSGITLNLVLKLAQQLDIPIKIRPIAEEEVRGADEIWLTSSLRDILPVTQLDHQPIADGNVGSMYRQLFQACELAILDYAASYVATVDAID
jgi:D-alanine transaminase